MKKNLFFTLILMFISLFIFNVHVNAEEIDPCYNDYLVSTTDLFKSNCRGYVSSDSLSCSTVMGSYSMNYLFSAEPSKTFYLRFFDSSSTSSTSPQINYFYLYDSYKNVIDSTSAFASKNLSNYLSYTYDSSNSMFILEFKDNIEFDYISFAFYPAGVLPTYKYFAYDNFDLSSCPVIEQPVDPVDPNNPTVKETDQAKILQNFYTLFLDRLKFISYYAINNYLFLAFIGIILIFVILEIFLYLYNKGGYK